MNSVWIVILLIVGIFVMMMVVEYMFGKEMFCEHLRLRPIYGDEIVFGTPNFNRLQCRDCGTYLPGPVEDAR